MKIWKSVLLVATVTAAAGLGAAIAPVAHGQTAPRAVAPRALQVLGGSGSQIGVSIRDVEQDDAKAGAGASAQPGVVVEDVTHDSPAEKAGIRKGDIVVEFDGERVRSVRQFTRLVQETPAGRKIAATLTRDGQKITVTVEPRENNGFTLFSDGSGRLLRDLAGDFRMDFPVPPAPPAAPARPAPPAAPAPPAPPMFPDIQRYIWRSGNSLGITISDLSSQLAEHFGVKSGVLVTSVSDGSAAAKAGVKAGDVITAVNGSEVSDPADLRRQVQRLQDGDEFTLGVVRDKKPMTLKGKTETVRSRRTYRTVVL